ncbi:SCO6880 family protein [Nocardiopsis sp. NPDC050513]|uniref:SCO6880 family protein n=1 Tax=Nocardiopsis sp. NPDC050513 TaxID=3364338 RepID=UPI0037BAD727
MVRTYGGWRRRRSIGLFGLGLNATLFLLGGLVLLMLSGMFAPAFALYLLPVLTVAFLFAAVPVRGESLLAFLLARLRWWWAKVLGHTRYRAGVMVEHPRAFQLPGILAPVALLSCEDGRGGRFGLAWNRRLGHMTATILVSSNSVWLAEPSDVDTWVANWHQWLASLGYMPWVQWVTVTVESRPAPGSALRGSVEADIDPKSPAAARKIMRDLVVNAPTVSAQVETRISVTFDPRKFPVAPKDRMQAAVEISGYLNQIETSLASTGVSVLGRATPEQLVAMVRSAYDPTVVNDLSSMLHDKPQDIGTLDWTDATPVEAEVHHDRYTHDSGTSVAWIWQEAPRTHVTSTVLAELLSPTRWIKRTTLLFRPWPAAAAARALEQQNAAAQYKSDLSARVRHRVSARDRQDVAYAQQAAQEETRGAGLVQVSLYTTATVDDEERLKQAVAHTESAAETSRIRLRRAWGSQDVAFATTLPLGVCPPFLIQRGMG